MEKRFIIVLLAIVIVGIGRSQTLINEGFEDGVIPPTGWTASAVCEYCPQDSWFGWNAVTTPHSGMYSAFVEYASPAHTSYLITPQLSITGHKILSFWYAIDLYDYSSTTFLTVEVSTTGTEPEDFTVLQTMTFPTTNFQFVQAVIDLQNYSGQNIYLAFHIEDAYGTGVYLDDIFVGDLPDCLPPTNLSASDISFTSMELSWSPLSVAPAYTVQYVISQSGWENPVSHTATDSTFLLTGLDPTSYYDIRVRAECGDSSSSVWSDIITVNTLCEYITVTPDNPWLESFETAVGTGQVALYNCWETPLMSTSYQTPALYCGLASAAHTGANTLELKGNNGEVNLLVFPIFTNDIQTLRMSFFANTTATLVNTAGTVEIGYITDPSDASTFTLLETLVPKTESLNRASSASYGPYYFITAADSSRIAIRFTSNTYSTSWNIDDITVSLIPSCTEPIQLVSSNVSATSAALSWITTGDHVYDILVWPSGTQDTIHFDSIPGSILPYTVTGLTPATNYSWLARTICSDSSYSIALTRGHFTTANSSIQIPYLQTFEGAPSTYEEYEFAGTGTNQWYIGAATGNVDSNNPNGGLHSMYISNNHGANNAYSGSGYSYAYASFDVQFPTDMVEYHLEFDYKLVGENNWDYLSVYLTDAGATLPTSGPPSGTLLLSGLNSTPNWTRANVILPNVVGNSKKIVFYWVNDSYYFGNPPAAVDNIAINAIACARPTNLTVTELQGNQVSLSWQENASSTSWTVHYTQPESGIPLTNITVDTTAITLTGLNPNTDYVCFVTANCDDGEVSSASPVASFRTPCSSQGISNLPYMESFSTYESLGSSAFDRYVPCWSRLTSNPEHRVYINIADFASDCLDFHYTPNCYTMAILPMLNPAIPANSVMLTFDAYRQDLSQGTLEVGVLTDPTNAGTFVVIDTVQLTTTYAWENQKVYCNTYTGQGQYLAFRVNNAGENPVLIDNLVVDSLPGCMPVSNVTFSNITTNSATITWSGDATSYLVFVSGPTHTVHPASDTTITLTNLQPSTSYTVMIQSNCDQESSPIAHTPGFSTLCGAITITESVSWKESFENYNAVVEAVPLSSCWSTPIVDSGFANNFFPAVYNFEGVAHSGSKTVEMSGDSCMLVLPEFTNDINTLRLSLWGNTSAISVDYAGIMEVGVISDINNLATFTVVDTVVPPALGHNGQDSPYADYVGPFDFALLTPAPGLRIALKYKNIVDPNISWNLDDITVALIPPCPSPVKNSVTVSNITHNQATVSWVDIYPGHTAWVVHYKPSSADDYSWQTVTVNHTNTVTLTNLISSTSYDVYVTTVCAMPSADATFTKQFTTTLPPTTLPYTATFTGQGEWQFTTGSSLNSWMTGVIPNTTTNALFVSSDNVNPGYNTSTDAVITAQKLFVVGTNAEIVISYDLNVGGEYVNDYGSENDYDYMKMFFTTSSETFEEVALGETPVWSTPYYSTHAFDFSNYLAQSAGSSIPYKYSLTNNNTVHIEAVVANPNPNPTDYSVANLVFVWVNDFIGGTQPGPIITNLTVSAVPCPKPQNMTVSNVTTTSADVSWDPMQPADGYIFEYKVSDSTTWTSINLTSNSYHLQGLSPFTDYDLRVRSDCGNELSQWTTMPLLTEYCEDSEKCTYTFYLSDYYGDGWNGAALNIVQEGHILHTITLNVGYTTVVHIPLCGNAPFSLTWTSGEYDQECTFYVYDPVGTQIYTSPSLIYITNPTLFTFTSNCTPILECEAPFSLYIDEITDSTAVAFWIMNGTEDSWVLQYKRSSDTVWGNDIPSLDNIFEITDLSAATSYDVRVKSLCSNGGVSDWSDTVTFTTTGVPVVEPSVMTLSAINIAQSSAMLRGVVMSMGNQTITEYGFEWKAATDADYTSVSVSNTSSNWTYNLTGLSPQTVYDYRAYVTTANMTTYGDVVTFETQEPCDPPTLLYASDFDAHSITVQWNINDNADSWDLRYRAQNGEWTTAAVSTNSYVITSLTAETTYEIQVQSDCGEGNLSEWSNSIFVSTTPDGINDYLFNSITLYPNPANTFVDVLANDNGVNVELLEVYDVYGKLISNVNVVDNPTRINVSDLASGMYFVRVTTEKGAVTKTFVKK